MAMVESHCLQGSHCCTLPGSVNSSPNNISNSSPSVGVDDVDDLFDSVVPSGMSTSARPSRILQSYTSLCCVLVVAVAVYTAWLVLSNSYQCHDNEGHSASPFWWYLVAHAGTWFWISLVAMASLFDITLGRKLPGAGQPFPMSTLRKATLCASGGAVVSGIGLYCWHVQGNRLHGAFVDIIGSKAIVMASVGLFGILATASMTIPWGSDVRSCKSFIEYMKRDGLAPVLFCCLWCFVWFGAEVCSQCFPWYSSFVSRHLPSILVPLAETAYVELYSVVFLPLLRLTFGCLERTFLRPCNRGDKDEAFSNAMRVISWVEILFEGFRWMYIRIVFSKAKLASLLLVSVYHSFVSFYAYLWKYSPHLTAARVAFWHSGGRTLPPWSRRFAGKPRLQKVVHYLTMVGKCADAVVASAFTSSYFVLSLESASVGNKAGPMRLAYNEPCTDFQNLKCVATLNVLNQRVMIAQPDAGHVITQPEATHVKDADVLSGGLAGGNLRAIALTTVWPLEMTEVVAAAMCSSESIADNQEDALWLGKEDAKETVCNSVRLANIHVCVLMLQQHIEMRLSLRHCMRFFSSLTLLSTNIILGAFDSHLVRDPVEKLSFSALRLWLFPLIMLLSDIVEAGCMRYTYRGWIFSDKAVQRWKKEIIRDKLFSLAYLCLLLHLSMSPTFGRHAMHFCT
eukprot:TRINITY_DN19337_c0_g1_i1.p1 TRINITY_DN19337_c0_g1~~TRINITY_DN19337_c0_g1_i1.p1  ORF type:complete len:681 (+),score=76.56 TRINITY_DN19337_c0_g1_i1:62-2104(+)